MTTDLLAGIRVLDFTLAAVGPFATRVLCDLGAEVIHVEWPRKRYDGQDFDPDATRFRRDQLLADNQSDQLFAHVNAGKKSLAINLKSSEGLDLIRELVASSDVVVENMTPRVMQNLGLTYAELKRINPRIVMCSMSGFGQAGLNGDTTKPCSDPIAQAMSGLSWLTGERDGYPYAIGGGIADTITSMVGVSAILAALVSRNTTGEGQYVDLAMVESVAYIDCTSLPYTAMTGRQVGARNGAQNSYTSPMGPLKAKDGYLSIQAYGEGPDSPWGRVAQLIGRLDMIDDPRYRTDADRVVNTADVVAAIEAWLASLPSRDVALTLFDAERVLCAPILSQMEMLTHPYFAERGTFGDVEYPGLGPVKMVQPPFKFSDAEAYVRGPAPEMGEHSRELLADILGLDDNRFEQLTQAGAVFESAAGRARGEQASSRS
jgi:CoA:oxalate CoA-transferase